MAGLKIIGYVLAVLGILGVISSSGKLHDVLPLIKSISTGNMLFISGVIALLGIGLVLSGGGRARQEKEEVPIYKGKKIIGYRKEE